MMVEATEAATHAIVYQPDAFVWSLSTLAMCAVGQMIHWLTSYHRARKASEKLGTFPPGIWLYWTGDWPVTVAALLTVFAGYFMLPEIGKLWPTIGQGLGVVAEDGTLVGLNMLSSFLWGHFGTVLADWAGKRLTKLVE
jgi:hypothetical protein